MRDAKLGSTALPRFSVDDDLGCDLDSLVDYPRPTLRCDPLGCVGTENSFMSWSTTQDPTRSRAVAPFFMRSTLTSSSLSMKYQVGTESVVKR